VPGTTLVADYTMVGWAGATNIQITYLPNKATDKGVCLKTLCNARTRVMINLEFVEGKGEQKKTRYTDEGRAAAVCLRLTEPWHNQVPRMLIADAWFGGAPTAVQLIHPGGATASPTSRPTLTISAKKSCGRMRLAARGTMSAMTAPTVS
jgi:hypothetical protein